MEQITPKKEWSVAIRWNHWIMAVLIFVKHGKNIGRLVAGTENRMGGRR